ncbi:hypothetical protein [Pseudanabaena sp. FACHB-2040]|uniref:hypothetical protein n=1 Tax=Pseudanabaena sp. FACHB-2040 TaxID=2692859 RepID=UPI001684A4DB|nr:hypothetical protein [Pseudanabaena sp. FACHB-2040]MBD2258335.1 hypothetical protein [Pseudanabaena sp. FACHB-2040]
MGRYRNRRMPLDGWTAGLTTAALLGVAPAVQANDITLAFDLPPTGAPMPVQADLSPEVTLTSDLPLSSGAASEVPVPSEVLEGPLRLERLPVPAAPPPVIETSTIALPPPPDSEGQAALVAPTGESDLFAGGSDSLVARAVGSAEGTRTPQGHRTSAYYGHVDPGNGAWNLGSFSYQHGAPSPEVADARQLQRLQRQATELNRQAQDKGLTLTLAETLNGIDLANQASLAALDRGYLDWLHQAHELGMAGDEAILYARTRAFLDPDTGRWNAPGLGNAVASISQDQERRLGAIAKTIALEQEISVASPISSVPQALITEKPEVITPQLEPTADQVVDVILSLDLP